MDKHTKIINDALIEERELALYIAQTGKLPVEYIEGEGYLQWVYPRTKESKEYVKNLIASNPTHTAKKPSRSKKPPTKSSLPWQAPKGL